MSAGEWLRGGRREAGHARVASMRPRRVCRGILVHVREVVIVAALASMRPRRVCRGMGRRRARSGRAHTSFNEAPACLPGNGLLLVGHVAHLEEASMRPRRVCRGMASSTPRSPSQWLPASMRPRRVCRGMFRLIPKFCAACFARFNEAPACLPGNAELVDPATTTDLIASMRPRRVCRGMADQAQLDHEVVHASMRPRRVCRGMLRRPGAGLLDLRRASMRPRRVCRGMAAIAFATPW